MRSGSRVACCSFGGLPWHALELGDLGGEAFKPEIGIRLAAKIAQLKRMPGETAE